VQQSLARFDDDLSNVVRGLAADVQISMALSRALLQTVAALSPACSVTAEHALQDEADRAVRTGSQGRVVAALEELHAKITSQPLEDDMCQVLEAALIKAAEQIPGCEAGALLSGLWNEAGPNGAQAS
jgi:hypothetical protein